MKDSSVLSSGTAYCYLLGKKDKPISLVARVTLPNPVHVYGAQSLSLLLGSVQTLNFTSWMLWKQWIIGQSFLKSGLGHEKINVWTGP